MTVEESLFNAEEAMEKAVDYLRNELRGVRTGRASTALVEYVKIDYFGSPTDLRSMAMISVPEPTQLLIKPFDPSTVQLIVKGLQASGLGLNPTAEGKQIRLSLPPLSGERRQQLIASLKHMAEQAKVTVRNARRDANKHIDQASKDKSQGVSEDEIESAKEEVQELVKRYEKQIEEMTTAKTKEIQEI